MSNAKNTQTEKAAATETPVKKDGPIGLLRPDGKKHGEAVHGVP